MGWCDIALFQEKMTSAVLSALNNIFHCHAHIRIFSRSWFISKPVSCSFFTTEKRDVPSANSFTLHDAFSGRSLMYTRKNNGPRTDPWGTPADTVDQLEDFQKEVKCFTGANIKDMHSYAKPSVERKPNVVILHIGTNDLSPKRNAEEKSAVQIAQEVMELAKGIREMI